MRLRRPFAAGSALGAARPPRLRDPGRGRPGLRARARPPRRHRPLGRALPADAPRRRPRRARSHERLSAFNAGIGVAGVAVHFKAWPWSLHRGVPMLDEAEGLTRGAAARLQRGALVLGDLQRPQPRSPRPARGARRFAARRPRSTSRSCSPPPATTSAGRASRPSCDPERWSPALLRIDERRQSGPAGARGALCLTFDNLGEAAEIELGRDRCRRPASAAPDRDRGAAGAARRRSATRGLRRDLLRRGPERRALPRAAARDRRRAATRSPTTPGATSSGPTSRPPSRPRTWPAGWPAFDELGLAGRRHAAPGGPLGAGRPRRPARGRACATARRPAPGPASRTALALLPFRVAPRRRQLRAAAARPAREQIARLGRPGRARRLPRLPRARSSSGSPTTAASSRSSSTRSCSSGSASERLGGAARPRRRGAADGGELWVAPCAEVAAHVLADPDAFGAAPTLDPTSWARLGPSCGPGRRRSSRAGSRGRRGGASSAACGAPVVSISTGRRTASIQAASSGR